MAIIDAQNRGLISQTSKRKPCVFISHNQYRQYIQEGELKITNRAWLLRLMQIQMTIDTINDSPEDSTEETKYSILCSQELHPS
jgi:hypothetical protein